MFIIKRKKQSMVLKPESVEDLWHLEKVIKPGDRVKTVTERKREEASGTSRETIKLEIEVEKTEFHKGYGKLKILGTITEGPEEHISYGDHHSFHIGERDVLTITKEKWKNHELNRIKEARKESKQPQLTVAIMDERKAQVFALKPYGLEEKARIQLPGKGKYAERAEKKEYYEEITQSLKRIDTDKYVIAGPGFEPDNYIQTLEEQEKEIYEKSTRMKTDNTGERGVYELMKKGRIDEYLKKSRLNQETKAINELIKEISREKGKATYGEEEVKKAVEYGAVKKLLVTDKKLFKNEEEVGKLMEKTEQKKGKTIVISEENPESEKLESLGGIAAVLRYKIN